MFAHYDLLCDLVSFFQTKQNPAKLGLVCCRYSRRLSYAASPLSCATVTLTFVFLNKTTNSEIRFCPQIAGVVIDDFWGNYGGNTPPPSPPPPPGQCPKCPSSARCVGLCGGVYLSFIDIGGCARIRGCPSSTERRPKRLFCVVLALLFNHSRSLHRAATKMLFCVLPQEAHTVVLLSSCKHPLYRVLTKTL